MTATYTFDVFATLDGYGSYDEHGDYRASIYLRPLAIWAIEEALGSAAVT